MHDKRDDYEPIIATRRSREPLHEDTQPLWRVVLAVVAVLGVAVSLGLWFMGRSPNDDGSTTAQSENSAPEVRPDILPEIEVEQEIAPPARDAESGAEVAQVPALPPPAPTAEIAQVPALPQPATAESAAGSEQAATPENNPEVVPDEEAEAPVPPPPAEVSVRFMSPDTQVQFEVHSSIDSSPPLMIKAGDVVGVAPGIYRVVVSGPQLETFQQEVRFDGERPLEYTVELCAQRKHERENLAGQVVEERACASTAQCESMFAILSEEADQLVKDRAFRTQQCAKWRPDAAPEGRWTLNIHCGGATLATTCRIEIAEGACSFAEPARSVRGGACPQAELE